ncbi:MAG: hypothetical protein HON47_05305 [Candidatus Diapherotrites archaeon]|jgi:hypothetical protein|uniref:Uncharacterized protein n=1 Tax=Candidatus Iainarchaeum sp. TaxID=3101447 RepID=A0A8T5GG44_9ARCH|nr:hypothetical protein [Candidatus Diapherotrites archaeon]MBT7241126.1 hypothetical protein [Candidatus Diapherotrites archaeon]
MVKKATKKKTEKYVELCPICGNREFSFFSGDKVTNIAGRELYECHRCANIFSFPIELPESKAKKVKLVPLTEKVKDSTPDSAYITLGRFEVGIYWKILGIAMALIGLAFMYVSTFAFLCYHELGEIVCVANNNPMILVLIGVANLFAGFYLLFESFVVFRTKHQLSRTLKILLVLGLLLVIYLVGYPFIFFLPLP